MHEGVPVLNRYYGVFENGKIKVRGIEARRRDTPGFIKEAQIEMEEKTVYKTTQKGASFLKRYKEIKELLKNLSCELPRLKIAYRKLSLILE
jgi:DNA polymerase-2